MTYSSSLSYGYLSLTDLLASCVSLQSFLPNDGVEFCNTIGRIQNSCLFTTYPDPPYLVRLQPHLFFAAGPQHPAIFEMVLACIIHVTHHPSHIHSDYYFAFLFLLVCVYKPCLPSHVLYSSNWLQF